MSNLDATFNKTIDSLRNSASKAGYVDAPWFAFEGLTDIKPETIRKAFNRDGTAKMYADALEPDVTFRAAQVAKIQGDVLSSVERDVTMRYRSRVRMFSHAAARYATHGLPEGPASGNIVGFLKILMDWDTNG